MTFSTGSALDASVFRARLDALFHNCPMNAAGLLEPNDHAKELWRRLSEHTYRDDKRGPMEARELLKKYEIEV